MGVLSRIGSGLRKSASRLSGGLQKLYRGGAIAAGDLEDLEEVLIGADMGLEATRALCSALAAEGRGFADERSMREFLAARISERLQEFESGFPSLSAVREVSSAGQVFVMLVVGVNGCGKTTTIAKLAQHYGAQGCKVLLAAGDLFRAAGSEQLAVWGERLGIDTVSAAQGGSAGGLIFDAHRKALREGYDILLIDTAGRLHNKADLMAELQKLDRVLKKQDAHAPHVNLLILDATGGKNSLTQAEAFHAIVPLTHILMTKLDSTAKGGILVALAQQMALPIMAIGVGETAEDLLPFEAHSFALALLGLEDV